MSKRLGIAAVWWVASVAVVAAQAVVNPTAVVFTPSTDHAIVTAYEFGYFAVGALAPTQVATVNKAQLTTVGTDYSFAFPRLLFGTYEHRLRACAGQVCSEWATADKASSVLPLAPATVRVK